MAITVFFWVVLGLLVAGDFKVVFRDEERAWVPLLVAGAVGALIFGYLKGALFGLADPVGFDPGTIVMCVLGAGVFSVIANKMIPVKPVSADIERRRAA